MLTLIPVRINDEELKKIKNPIFLGTWSFSKGDIEGYINNIPYVPYCYDNYELLQKDYEYSLRLYEKIIVVLNRFINNKFNLKWNIKSTKIFFGLWLLEFIQIVLEKYRLLIYTTTVLKLDNVILTNDLCVINDYEDFNANIQEDFYNHVLVSKIVKYVDSELYDKSSIIQYNMPFLKKNNDIFIKDIIKINIQKFFNVLTKNSATLVDRAYFSNKDMFKLFIYDYPNIRPLFYIPNNNNNNNNTILKDTNIREELKSKLKNFIFENIKFENILINLLIDEMPLAYLENFKYILSMANNIEFSGNVYSANNLFVKDVFKCSVANNCKKLIIGQHGGSYGIAEWNTREFWERDISDKYITFGWTDKNDAKVLPLSHPKLFKNIDKKTIGLKIMYISTNNPRYIMTNWSNPIAGMKKINYFKNIKYFYKHLSKDIKEKFFLRLHPNDFGIGFKEYLKEINNKFSTGDFYSEMSKSSLIICDHNQTSFLESIVMNKPTIIFWLKEDWKIRNEAKIYFSKLEEVGIFYSNIDKLLDFINSLNIINIQEWWNEPKRKLIVDEFRNTYVKKNNTWLSDYTEAFS